MTQPKNSTSDEFWGRKMVDLLKNTGDLAEELGKFNDELKKETPKTSLEKYEFDIELITKLSAFISSALRLMKTTSHINNDLVENKEKTIASFDEVLFTKGFSEFYQKVNAEYESILSQLNKEVKEVQSGVQSK
jgi:hypothetical protein